MAASKFLDMFRRLRSITTTAAGGFRSRDHDDKSDSDIRGLVLRHTEPPSEPETSRQLSGREGCQLPCEIIAEREPSQTTSIPALRSFCGPGYALRARREVHGPRTDGKVPTVILTSVDLSAPLSPTRLTISPGDAMQSTSMREWHPYSMPMPRSSRRVLARA